VIFLIFTNMYVYMVCVCSGHRSHCMVSPLQPIKNAQLMLFTMYLHRFNLMNNLYCVRELRKRPRDAERTIPLGGNG
jgi:hypothetical protein